MLFAGTIKNMQQLIAFANIFKWQIYSNLIHILVFNSCQT